MERVECFRSGSAPPFKKGVFVGDGASGVFPIRFSAPFKKGVFVGDGASGVFPIRFSAPFKKGVLGAMEQAQGFRSGSAP
ncbi:hypothetical protein B5G16_10830 [Alistipes sp. An66]|nr:hypothetical protein B5G16_10830 [Alistipes sp. An66]